MNKTKKELLAMTPSELDEERKIAWKYYKKVQAVEEFNSLED
tara:strand:+ start:178 stop:303 length:126 start_codon:yes stop_codon:yes gene_type:complete